MVEFLIGVDDTDNLASRGTGHLARALLAHLAAAGLATPLAVTRHQLLVSPDIPYTSHNSSACLRVHAAEDAETSIAANAAAFVVRESASGSDPGLCVAPLERVGGELIEWGRSAKRRVLAQEDALQLASAGGLALQGLGGTNQGVVGALAALGLHAWGDDGRLLWLPGLRDLPQSGLLTCAELLRRGGIAHITTTAGEPIGHNDRVSMQRWVRPIWSKRGATLLVDERASEEADDGGVIWHLLSKEEVKRLSS